ncbi:MAG: NAD(P)H-dependent oxidoreductase [Pseudomonadota bacterium]
MTVTKRHILRIDASMRHNQSTTRGLTDAVIAKIGAEATVATRDLTQTLPFVDETWINANFTDPDARTEEQRAALALSDTLIAEIQAADTLVIGLPIYNFGVPAALKAWFDLVARARVTFKYTENGPVGLLEGKRAILVAASGGTEVGSEIDFAVPWMKHVLGFIGIQDVTVIDAGQQMMKGDEAVTAAEAEVAKLAA